MTVPLSFNPSHTAVLSMEFHASIVSVYVKDEGLIARAAGVLKQVRNSGMRIIHVQVGFRPKFPEIGTRNALFSSLKKSVEHQQMFEGPAGAIHASVAPEGDDIVVTKHRVGAFPGTDLDMILRANEIDTLILFGIATSGVVLSTLRHASDADYRLIVIKDCCADQNPEVHACLMDKVFPRQATVISAGDFLDALKSSW
jgi:nicotinamidase-related amidase